MDTIFDPIKFKETTRQQWDTVAESWNRWNPLLEKWLGPATDLMFEMAGISEGSRVLDIAAGAGGPAIRAAKRVGPNGSIVATDISPGILEFAQRNAKEAGCTNVETITVDGEQLDFPEATFDAAISRVGLIYFPDPQRALAGIRRSLRDGGRFATVTYSTPEKNPFFSIPVTIIRRVAQLPSPLPGQPGPFSLGADGVLAQTLDKAGFRDVEVKKVEAPIRLVSAAECLRFERESFGALHQMLSAVTPDKRNAAWLEIETELSKFESSDGFVGPCELLVASGAKPRECEESC